MMATRGLRMFKRRAAVEQVRQQARLTNETRLAEYIGEVNSSPRLDTSVFCRPRCKPIASAVAVGLRNGVDVAARRAHVASISTMCKHDGRQRRDVQITTDGGSNSGADV